jgi:hypothetical protein
MAVRTIFCACVGFWSQRLRIRLDLALSSDRTGQEGAPHVQILNVTQPLVDLLPTVPANEDEGASVTCADLALT